VTPPPATDTREEQAGRVADFLALYPARTLAELDAACDLGSPSKVLSAMVRDLGYGIRRGWRRVPSAVGKADRRRRTYTLTHRPPRAHQLSLFPDR
jgi:hypothetical protein